MFKQPAVMWEPGPQPEGGQSGNCPPKFLKTYVFVRYSNKLYHFALPPKISVGGGPGGSIGLFSASKFKHETL